MTIGALRRRATLQSEVLTPDGGGGHGLGWADVATLWAEIVPVAGSEAPAAGRMQAVARCAVVIRHRPGVVAGMRLLADGRTFNIRGVQDDGRGRWLRLLCEEGAAT